MMILATKTWIRSRHFRRKRPSLSTTICLRLWSLVLLVGSHAAFSPRPTLSLSHGREDTAAGKGGALAATSPQPQQQQLLFAQEIRTAFADKETDGILEIAQSTLGNAAMDVDEVVSLLLLLLEEEQQQQQQNNNKARLASLLNGLLGASCLVQPPVLAVHRARQLWTLYETNLHDRRRQLWTPDLVTLSLAYHAFSMDVEEENSSAALLILDQALRRSKKLASSARRKTLAAVRRKPLSDCTSQLDELRRLLGSDDFDVLDETEDWVVVNKPSGVVCFHNKATTAGKISSKRRTTTTTTTTTTRTRRDVSLESALVSRNIPLSSLNPDALGIVHRLDRGSSGCLVLAKTNEMHLQLLSQFFLRQSQKTYTTVVSPIPSTLQGNLTIPVDGRPAKSSFRVVDTYNHDGNHKAAAAALVEMKIFTGRKHQVRVHAAKGLSCPVLMDDLYGGKWLAEDEIMSSSKSSSKKKSSKCPPERFFLHASELVLPNCGIRVKAPTPSWWEEKLASLKIL